MGFGVEVGRVGLSDGAGPRAGAVDAEAGVVPKEALGTGPN